jgi:hypothetical protein
MRVFLVEKVIGKLEPIAIETNWTIASGLIKADDVGIITEMNHTELKIITSIFAFAFWANIIRHQHLSPQEYL